MTLHGTLLILINCGLAGVVFSPLLPKALYLPVFGSALVFTAIMTALYIKVRRNERTNSHED